MSRKNHTEETEDGASEEMKIDKPITIIKPPSDYLHGGSSAKLSPSSENTRTIQTDFGTFTVNRQGQMVEADLALPKLQLIIEDDSNTDVSINADQVQRKGDKYMGSRMYLMNTSHTSARILRSVAERQRRLERGTWRGDIELLLVLGSAMCGVDFVVLYPRLWLEYGGAAFQLAYMVCCAVIALPVFGLEATLGQYTAHGLTAALPQMAPALKGFSYGIVLNLFLVTACYMPEVATVASYGIASMKGEDPWASCHKFFHTDICYTHALDRRCVKNGALMYLGDGCVTAKDICDSQIRLRIPKSIRQTCITAHNVTTLNITDAKSFRVNAGVEYFDSVYHSVTITDGEVTAPSLVGLSICWLAVILLSMIGFRNIRYTLPILFIIPILTAVIIPIYIIAKRGLAKDWKLMVPDVNRLEKPMCWFYAAIFSLRSTNIGTGINSVIYSRNLLTHDCKRSSVYAMVIASCLATVLGFSYTLILGHAAQQENIEIEDMIDENRHLHPLIIFANAMSSLEGFHTQASILLITTTLLGLGCAQIFILTLEQSLRELNMLGMLRTITSVIILSGGMFILNVLFMFPTGYFTMLTTSIYTANSFIILLSLTLIVCTGGILGVSRLLADMHDQMAIHMRWTYNYWYIMWRCLCPALLLMLFIGKVVTHETKLTVYHHSHKFPDWISTFGSIVFMVPIIMFVVVVFRTYWKNRWQDVHLFTPTALWSPGLMTPPDQSDNNVAGDSSHFLMASAPSLMTTIYSDISEAYNVTTVDGANSFPDIYVANYSKISLSGSRNRK